MDLFECYINDTHVDTKTTLRAAKLWLARRNWDIGSLVTQTGYANYLEPNDTVHSAEWVRVRIEIEGVTK